MPANRELELLTQATRDLCERLDLNPKDQKSTVQEWYNVSCGKFKNFPELNHALYLVKLATLAGKQPQPPVPAPPVWSPVGYALMCVMIGIPSAVIFAMPFLELPQWVRAGLTGGLATPVVFLLVSKWFSQWQTRLRLFVGSAMVLKSTITFTLVVYSNIFKDRLFINIGSSQNLFTDSLVLVIGYLLLKPEKSAK